MRSLSWMETNSFFGGRLHLGDELQRELKCARDCDHMCIESSFGPMCACRDGFRLYDDMRTCVLTEGKWIEFRRSDHIQSRLEFFALLHWRLNEWVLMEHTKTKMILGFKLLTEFIFKLEFSMLQKLHFCEILLNNGTVDYCDKGVTNLQDCIYYKTWSS